MKVTNWYGLTGIIIAIVAVVFGNLADIAIAEMIEVAGIVIGATIAVLSVSKKHEGEKDTRYYVAMGGIIISSVLLVLGGMTEQAITGIIGAIGLVVTAIFAMLKKA